MQKRKLGMSELLVSELALGTWGLSGDGYGKVSEHEQDAVIDRALALGITLFETADSYARGAMERKLGERLPAEAIIVTKIGTERDGYPPRKRFDRAFLLTSLDESRKRLKRDVLDVVLLHNPSAAGLRSGEAAGVLAECVAKGSVKLWGVSAGDVATATTALQGQHCPDVLQMAHNLLFSQDFTAIEHDLESRRVGFLARSVLGYGLLAGLWPQHHKFGPGDHRSQRWTPNELERRRHELSLLRPLLSPELPTLRAVALRYVLDNPRVTAAVLGPRDVTQLDQLVRESGGAPPYLDPTLKERLTLRLMDLGAFD